MISAASAEILARSDFWHSHHWIDIRDWLGVVATSTAAGFAAFAIRQSSNDRAAAEAAATKQRQDQYTLSTLRELHRAVLSSQDYKNHARWLDVDQALLACPLRMPLTRVAFRIGETDAEREVYLRYASSSRGATQWPTFEISVAVDEIARETLRLLDSKRETLMFESLQERIQNYEREEREQSLEDVEVSPKYQEPNSRRPRPTPHA